MAKKDQAYDHPTYTARDGQAMGEIGGAATTQYAKFVAFAAMQAYSAQLTVTTAGTAAGHGFQVVKISGTATTALGTATLGTGAAGTTANLVLTNVAGGVALLAGDILATISLADVVGKAALSIEYNVQPLAQVTA
jgi:hypothetical protein